MNENMVRFNEVLIRTIRYLRDEKRQWAGIEGFSILMIHQFVSLWQSAIVTFGVSIFGVWAKALSAPLRADSKKIGEMTQDLALAMHHGASHDETMAQMVAIWQALCTLPGVYNVLTIWGESVLQRERNRSGLCATPECENELLTRQTWPAICPACMEEVREIQAEGDAEVAKLEDWEVDQIEADCDERHEQNEAEEEAIELELKGKKHD